MTLLAYGSAATWTDPETPVGERLSSRTFQATPFATRRLLLEEASKLDASDAIVELVAPAASFYKDGTGIRADRSHTVAHVGVVVRLIGTKHGDLRYACDRFNSWEANLRAVALGLSDLRRVERYGIARRGEQYAGWAQLGAGVPMGAGQPPEAMTLERAGVVLAGGTDGSFTPREVLADLDDARAAYRVAAKRYHPDRGGSAEAFRTLEEAWRLIAGHHAGGTA